MGLSWDKKGSGLSNFMGVDLDLIAIATNAEGRGVRMAGLDVRDPFGNGSLHHSGDNRTGRGAGDDETLEIRFADVPAVVHGIVFVAAAFKRGASFKRARNVAMSIYNTSGGSIDKRAEYWPPLDDTGNAYVIAKVQRTAVGHWELEIIERMGSVAQADEASILRLARS